MKGLVNRAEECTCTEENLAPCLEQKLECEEFDIVWDETKGCYLIAPEQKENQS